MRLDEVPLPRKRIMSNALSYQLGFATPTKGLEIPTKEELYSERLSALGFMGTHINGNGEEDLQRMSTTPRTIDL